MRLRRASSAPRATRDPRRKPDARAQRSAYPRPMSVTSAWDLCVLGAGPAGYAAAMRAHDLGKRVVIVEQGRTGGAGIHSGALSSKTMWHLSNDYACASLTDRGYRAVGGIDVSYAMVIESV